MQTIEIIMIKNADNLSIKKENWKKEVKLQAREEKLVPVRMISDEKIMSTPLPAQLRIRAALLAYWLFFKPRPNIKDPIDRKNAAKPTENKNSNMSYPQKVKDLLEISP